MPPTLKLSSEVMNMGDLGEYKGVILENQFPFLKPKCHSHHVYLKKLLEMIRITETATFALMRGSLPDLYHIKYI